MTVNLDQLEQFAQAASEWMPDLPWGTSRRCSGGSLGYIVGLEGSERQWTDPAGDLIDTLDPQTVLALTRAVRALELLANPIGEPKTEEAALYAMEVVRIADAALEPFRNQP